MTIDTEVAMLALNDSARACEKVEPGLFGHAGIFDEALRRMKHYDTTMLPQHYRKVLESGVTIESILQHAGRKSYAYTDKQFQTACDILDMAVARQVPVIYPRFSGTGIDTYVHLPFATEWLPRRIEQELREGLTVTHSTDRESFTYVPLSDKSPLGTMLFCKVLGKRYSELIMSNMKKNHLFCIEPDLKLGGEANVQTLLVGNIEVPDLEAVAVRRFTYVFGQPPATSGEITDALVELNAFPRGRDGRELEYSLKEMPLKEAKPTRGALLAWEEAKAAKEAGLFADVRVYALDEAKVRPRDPVIVGIDDFDQKFPITYWGGDKPKVVE
jgi:hypothetical protein